MDIVLYIVFLFIVVGVVVNVINYISGIKKNNKYIDNLKNTFNNTNYSNEAIVINTLDDIKNMKQIDKSITPDKTLKLEIINNNINYQLPPIDLLDYQKNKYNYQKEIEKNTSILEKTFKDFKVKARICSATVGPFFTQYEVELEKGEKVSKLTGIRREIALALAKENVKIETPIPRKNNCGIDIDNIFVENISLREVIKEIPKSRKFAVALGKDIYGNIKYLDMNESTNILLAGSTGMGKSICIRSIITSILMRAKPDEVKLLLVDPKKLELSMYNGIPHLLSPVITNPRKGINSLQKIITEIEHRHNIFGKCHVKDIKEYNNFIEKKNETRNGNDKLLIMYHIVVIIDEIADLIKESGDDVEKYMINIMQMSRLAGVHMIISTQLPTVPFVSRIVKTNITTRIAFDVPTASDSRAILGIDGAEKLRGNGDMLFLPPKSISPIRIKGTWISDSEIKRVVNFVCNQQKVQYDTHFQDSEVDKKEVAFTDLSVVEKDEYDDPLYDDVVEFVVKNGKASASLLQRRFKFSYTRASRVIDLLEKRGIIGPMNGIKPREVLVKLNVDDMRDDTNI